MESYILSVEHIMKHIALALRSMDNSMVTARPVDFLNAHHFDFRIAITTDVYESEYEFTQKYGVGYSFNFSLKSYDEGRKLAAEIYQLVTGHPPDMKGYTGAQFKSSDLLSLFIYLRKVVQPREERALVAEEMIHQQPYLLAN